MEDKYFIVAWNNVCFEPSTWFFIDGGASFNEIDKVYEDLVEDNKQTNFYRDITIVKIVKKEQTNND